MALTLNASSGNLSQMTTCVYRLLAPVFPVPIEPLLDIIPGVTGNRVPIDLVESENWNDSFNVTDHAVQDFATIQNNVHIAPRILSVSGVLTGIFQSVVGPIAGGGGPPGFRADLQKLGSLRALARARQPVLVITPRDSVISLITSIDDAWDPELGENTRFSISFKEVRLVSPLTGSIAPDTAAQLAGNNKSSGGGQQVPQDQAQQFGSQSNPLVTPYPL